MENEVNINPIAHVLSDTVQSMMEDKSTGSPKGISTGIHQIDTMLGGLQGGNLYIIGARPGMGKSSLALQLACNAAKDDNRVLFVSLEMTNKQLVTRLLSSQTGIKHTALRDCSISEMELGVINLAVDKLKDLPLYLVDQTALTINDITIAVEYNKPDILFIDYLGLIQPARNEDRRIEVDKISYALKSIAKYFNIPVVCLSQLRRGTIGSDDSKCPSLSDLRDSGAIEQAADAVILIHRNRKDELHIAKNRHGETGVINANWYGDNLRFYFDNKEKCEEIKNG
ncbi:MAG: DnaB-like helicase C-terminal domain-containing protein [Clostridium sp.]|uniref:DnaB-like helicase C-terminal domain-containing protein n=1 Tax=Clostridium sp. TaxID=1506 RepID=UPI00290E7144|nr:DnaB-like helicase C-terminal domain-containing protein [Clostridium sp.]MDU7337932.1 DnaB-like helicase C-terminal domain-containing protein [Clostridium sp.]